LHAIANFAYKGMEHKGFLAIKDASIKNHRLEVLKRVLEKYFLTKFMKKYIKSAFNNWKAHEFVEIQEDLDLIHSDYKSTVNKFSNKIVNIKDQNTKNVEHYIHTRWRNKIFKAWVKSRKDQRIRLIQKEELKLNVGVVK
jgi:hypothetical protein